MIVEQIPLGKIEDNPFQPRLTYDEEAIRDLAEDIRRRGLLQPPVGRRMGNGVQLAFGHRRLRAFRLLAEEDPEQWGKMPVEIRPLSDPDMALYAWSENEARADLNPVERAEAIRRMMDAFGWTQQQVADRLGMSRSAVANMLRLLRLPEEVREAVREGRLSERQAVALVPFYDLPEVARKRAEQWWAGHRIREVVEGKRQVSSDDLRKLVREAVREGSLPLAEAPFAGTEAAEGCKDCEHRDKGRCLNPECYEEKSRAAQEEELQLYAEITGLPVLSPDQSYRPLYHEDVVRRALKKRCPHLHLTTARGRYGLNPDGAEHTIYVCDHVEGECECSQEVDREREEQRRRLDAEKQRIEERLARKLVEALEKGDAGAWRAVARVVLPHDEQEKIAHLSRAAAVFRVARHIVRRATYGGWGRAPEEVESAFYTWAGDVGLELPEDDPLALARQRYLRVRGWSDGARRNYPTPEMVRGNIANLRRLLDDLTAMAQDGRPEAASLQSEVAALLRGLEELAQVVDEWNGQNLWDSSLLLSSDPGTSSFKQYLTDADTLALRYALALARGWCDEERVAALERELERRNGQSQ